MATQRLKGLWIPAEILLNEELTDKEKLILAMILYLSEETASCFASNKYIANIVNIVNVKDAISESTSAKIKEIQILSTSFDIELGNNIIVIIIFKISSKH